jgi:hypothetical protein
VILGTRWTQNTEPRKEVLVQWCGLPADDTTWDDWETLKTNEVGNVSKGYTTEVGHYNAKGNPKRKTQLLKHLEDCDLGGISNSVRKN